jgi:predicted nucleic acid-binding protein
MTGYLLDTNHVSPLVTLGHPLRTRVLAELSLGQALYVSTSNLSEITFGFALTQRADQNFALWAQMLERIGILTLSADESIDAGYLQAAMRRRGQQLKTIDAHLAVQAIVHDLTLLTTDTDFKQVPRLRSLNWIESLA